MKKISGIILILLFINIVFATIDIIGLNINILMPFQDYKALCNVEKYFIIDTLIIDKIKINSESEKRSNSHTTIITGKIISSGINKKIVYSFEDDFYKKYLFKNSSALKVIRNKINNNILINEDRLLKYRGVL